MGEYVWFLLDATCVDELPVVDRIHPQICYPCVENKAAGDSKLNDSPAYTL